MKGVRHGPRRRRSLRRAAARRRLAARHRRGSPARELRANLALGGAAARRRCGTRDRWRRPSARLSPLGAIGLIAAYAIAQQVQFDVGAGYTVPSQLVLMPMLMLAPPALVPLLVAAGLLVGRLPALPAPRGPPAAAWPSCCPTPGMRSGRRWSWPLLGPRQPGLERLAGAGRSPSSRRRSSTPASAVLRDWLAHGVAAAAAAAALRLGLRRRRLRWLPVGVLARRRRRAPAARRGAACCRSWACSRSSRASARAHIDKALALSHAYRGTALLMSDLLEADDAYTGGEHSHGVVALALAVGDALGLDARDRRNLEFAALLHDIGKIRVPDEIINKPGKLDRRGVRAHQAPPRRRAGDARARRRRARRGRADRPPPPRALGRRRLSRRHRRRGDPAGGAHHLRLRRLQRDDDQPALPRRAADGRRGRRARALLGRAVRPEPWSTRCCGRSPSTPSTAPRGRCSSSPPERRFALTRRLRENPAA